MSASTVAMFQSSYATTSSEGGLYRNWREDKNRLSERQIQKTLRLRGKKK